MILHKAFVKWATFLLEQYGKIEQKKNVQNVKYIFRN